MATIAAVQAAFARNFPFRSHGPKIEEKAMRDYLKDLIKSDSPGRLIG